MIERDSRLTPDFAGRIARLALDGIHRDYPNKIAHVLNSDADARPPRELTPIFYGCFDWHSAVHSHWCLIRLLRCFPDADWTKEAREKLRRSFSADRAAAELAYLIAPDRAGFECPYGLAWLLQLCAELHEWDDTDGRNWSTILAPLERLAVERFREWLPKLSHPIRSGEHSQTAFAMGLLFDWAVNIGNQSVVTLVTERARSFHYHDVNAPLHFEPSGHDFLSPSLAEADLMRRVLPADEFREWLSRFLPELPTDASDDWLLPAGVSDSSDGKLAHLHGLNLSRVWMLEGIVDGLSEGDARRSTLRATANRHSDAGLSAVRGEHYAVSHWLGSFAVYLLTRRGLV